MWLRRKKPASVLAVLDELDKADAMAGAVSKTTLGSDILENRRNAEEFLQGTDRQADDLAGAALLGWEVEVEGHRFAITNAGNRTKGKIRGRSEVQQLPCLSVDGVPASRSAEGAGTQEIDTALHTFARHDHQVIEAFMHLAVRETYRHGRTASLSLMAELGVEPKFLDVPPRQQTRYHHVHSQALALQKSHAQDVYSGEGLSLALQELHSLINRRHVALESTTLIEKALQREDPTRDEVATALAAVVKETSLADPPSRKELRAALRDPSPQSVDDKIAQLRTMVGVVVENRQLLTQAADALSTELRTLTGDSPFGARVKSRFYEGHRDLDGHYGIRRGSTQFSGDLKEHSAPTHSDLMAYVSDGSAIRGQVVERMSQEAAQETSIRDVHAAGTFGAEVLRRRINPDALGL